VVDGGGNLGVATHIVQGQLHIHFHHDGHDAMDTLRRTLGRQLFRQGLQVAGKRLLSKSVHAAVCKRDPNHCRQGLPEGVALSQFATPRPA
jgi:hypothetical protein